MQSAAAQVIRLTDKSGNKISINLDDIVFVRPLSSGCIVMYGHGPIRQVVSQSIDNVLANSCGKMLKLDIQEDPSLSRITLGALVPVLQVLKIIEHPDGRAILYTKSPQNQIYITALSYTTVASQFAACISGGGGTVSVPDEVIQGTVAPTNPPGGTQGGLYLNTALGDLYAWNGSVWILLSNPSVYNLNLATPLPAHPQAVGSMALKIVDGIGTRTFAMSNGTAWIGASGVFLDTLNVNTINIASQAVTGAKINQMGATSGQVLKWNGSAWAPAADTGGGSMSVPNAYDSYNTHDTLTENRLVTMQDKRITFAANTTAGTTRTMLRMTTPYSSDDAFTNYLVGQSPVDSFKIYNYDGITNFRTYGGGGLQIVTTDETMILQAATTIQLDADSVRMAYLPRKTFARDLMVYDSITKTVSRIRGTATGQSLNWDGTKWVPGIISTLYTANGTVGAGRIATLTDSLAFKGVDVVGGDALVSIEALPTSNEPELLRFRDVDGGGIMDVARGDAEWLINSNQRLVVTVTDGDMILAADDVSVPNAVALNQVASLGGLQGTFGSGGEIKRFVGTSDGQIPKWNGTGLYWELGTDATGGGGGVTSVGIALPGSVFAVSGTPVTTTGTLTGNFVDQVANTVFAGPTTGVSATPFFRALVAADIPSLTGTYEVPLTFGSGLTRTGNAVANDFFTGKSGGLTLYGDTGPGGNLTISTTTNATKGKVFLGGSAAYDEANVRLGIGLTSPTSKIDILTNNIGVTQGNANGLTIMNTTAAAAGAQQMSPGILWEGQGWKTTATAASQSVRFMADVLPVQGTTAPAGTWQLKSSIDGGAYTNRMTVGSDGSFFAGLTSGNNITINSSVGAQLSGGSNGTFRIRAINGGYTTFFTVGQNYDWNSQPGTWVFKNENTSFGNNSTTGTGAHVVMSETFKPTSGSAVYSELFLNPIINQTSTASGATYGLRINPTLTSVLGVFTGLELNQNAQTAILQSGASAINSFVGKSGFGATTTPVEAVDITGNLSLTTAGNKIKIATGSNASLGTATLVTGTVTVNTTAVATGSTIMLTCKTPGGTQGFLSYGTIVNATSFVITSSSGADTSVVDWLIIN